MAIIFYRLALKFGYFVYVEGFIYVLQHKYDLVVSGFTFIELGTLAERMQTLLSLWEKTEKYLVSQVF